jgi:hypothetical protein
MSAVLGHMRHVTAFRRVARRRGRRLTSASSGDHPISCKSHASRRTDSVALARTPSSILAIEQVPTGPSERWSSLSQRRQEEPVATQKAQVHSLSHPRCFDAATTAFASILVLGRGFDFRKFNKDSVLCTRWRVPSSLEIRYLS